MFAFSPFKLNYTPQWICINSAKTNCEIAGAEPVEQPQLNYYFISA